MPINQPPITDNPVDATWNLEVTQTINSLEERLRELLNAINDSIDLDDLKTKIQRI